MQQRIELVVDLGLSAAAHLVVALLQDEAGVDQVGQHLVAQVDVLVVGGHWEIPALVADLVAPVGTAVGLGRRAGVPPPRDGVHLVEGAVGARVEAHRIENVELGLGAEVCGVGDASADQVVLGLAGDVARVAGVRLQGERVVHKEVDIQRLGRAERVDARRLGIGKKQHVGFVDRLEPANRRAVKGQAVVKHALVKGRSRNREVLHDARQVTEPDVDIFDLLVLGKFEDVVGRLFRHRMLLYCIRGRRYGADIARQSTPCCADVTDRAAHH
ncbi:Uncharacterised protein [Mycobacterium tuberculosis]|uniref:Uncharacterized protein n=1 Tax=Mycobacterium tuberculosis TaxID=1773 RepID=A0A655FIJ0_MYCTX|nr:Uncharacterised protein [Mycobacterium tuberculosis]